MPIGEDLCGFDDRACMRERAQKSYHPPFRVKLKIGFPTWGEVLGASATLPFRNIYQPAA